MPRESIFLREQVSTMVKPDDTRRRCVICCLLTDQGFRIADDEGRPCYVACCTLCKCQFGIYDFVKMMVKRCKFLWLEEVPR